MIVARSRDVNVFVHERKTVFVSRTRDMSVLVDRSHVPGGLARFDNSQNVEMSSGLIAARSVVASIPAVQSLRFVQTAGACWVKHVGSREANSTSRVLLGEGLLFSEDRQQSQRSCGSEGYL